MFPFLAVLLCTMGALIVVLVVIARHAQLQVAAEAQRAADQAGQSELATKRDELQWRIDELKKSRDQTKKLLNEKQLELSHIEDHARRIRDKLEELAAAKEHFQEMASGDAKENEELKSRLSRLRIDADRTKAEIEKLRRKNGPGGESYAIIPYHGPNETRRRPIYIECRGDSVILQPEGIVLTPEDFLVDLGPSNPLVAALRAAREYHVRNQLAGKSDRSTPYPLFIIRPDGIEISYGARGAIASWGPEFGYELVAQDWPLEYPPPDPMLTLAMRQAVSEGRIRQAYLARAAPMLSRSGSHATFRAGRNGGIVQVEGSPGGGPHRGQMRPRGFGGHRGGTMAGGAGGRMGGGGQFAGDASGGLTGGGSNDSSGDGPVHSVDGSDNPYLDALASTSAPARPGRGGTGSWDGSGGNTPYGSPYRTGGGNGGGVPGAGGGLWPTGSSGRRGNGSGSGDALAAANGPGKTPGTGSGTGIGSGIAAEPGGESLAGTKKLGAGSGTGTGKLPRADGSSAGSGSKLAGGNSALSGSELGGAGSGTAHTPGGTARANVAGGAQRYGAGGANSTGQSGEGPGSLPGSSMNSQASAGSNAPGTNALASAQGVLGGPSSGLPRNIGATAPGGPYRVAGTGGTGSAGPSGPGNSELTGNSSTPGGVDDLQVPASSNGYAGARVVNQDGTARADGTATRGGSSDASSDSGSANPTVLSESRGTSGAGGPSGGNSASGGRKRTRGQMANIGPAGASGGTGSQSSASSSSSSMGGMGSSASMTMQPQMGGLPSPNLNFGQQNQQAPESMAKRRDKNWANPDASTPNIPIQRQIRVVCDAEHLTLLPEGRGRQGMRVIPFKRGTVESVDELVSTVWDRIDSWGTAGRGMYWRPVLMMEVEPGGQRRYAELQALLADSGFDMHGMPRRRVIFPAPARNVRAAR